MCFFVLPLFFKIFCNGARRYNEVPLRNNSYYQSIKKFFDIYTKRTVVLHRGWFFFFRASRPWKFRRIQTAQTLFIYFFASNLSVNGSGTWFRPKNPLSKGSSDDGFLKNILWEMLRVKFFYFLPLVLYEFNRVESATSSKLHRFFFKKNYLSKITWISWLQRRGRRRAQLWF